MAFNNTEVELKAPLTEPQFKAIKATLDAAAQFIGKSTQIDVYYVPSVQVQNRNKYPDTWVSIRRRDGKTLLNFKKYHSISDSEYTHCDEYETEISDPASVDRILTGLNVEKLATVEKCRLSYTYKDDFEVALDQVKGLGKFIEVEALKDFGGVEAARNELFKILRSFGLDPASVDYEGYPCKVMKL